MRLIRRKFVKCLDVAQITEVLDTTISNLLPKPTSGSSEKLSSNKFTAKLDPIRGNPSSDDFDEIQGNTYRRIYMTPRNVILL